MRKLVRPLQTTFLQVSDGGRTSFRRDKRLCPTPPRVFAEGVAPDCSEPLFRCRDAPDTGVARLEYSINAALSWVFVSHRGVMYAGAVPLTGSDVLRPFAEVRRPPMAACLRGDRGRGSACE